MPERKNHLDALAISLLVACCLFWGFQQILIKTTVGEVPPLWQASLRMLGATALLWGAILAYSSWYPYTVLTRWLGNRRGLAALLCPEQATGRGAGPDGAAKGFIAARETGQQGFDGAERRGGAGALACTLARLSGPKQAVAGGRVNSRPIGRPGSMDGG